VQPCLTVWSGPLLLELLALLSGRLGYSSKLKIYFPPRRLAVKKKSANGPFVDFDDCILECLDAGSRTVCWLLHLRIVFECSLIDREEQPQF